MTKETLRERIFNIVTDPVCQYWEIGHHNYCEFWDVQGHYCFLKDMHQDTIKCRLIDQILNLIKEELKGLTVISEDEIVAEASKDSTYCQLSVDIGIWAVNRQLSHTIKELKDKLGG